MLKQAEELLEKIKASGSYDYDKILKAYNYAERLHEGQKRISGEDYIMHPLSVAEIVFDLIGMSRANHPDVFNTRTGQRDDLVLQNRFSPDWNHRF